MATNFSDVGEFHRKFGLPAAPYVGPELPAEVLEFRRKFMQEELDEFTKGRDEGDIAQMADALIDLVYVALGTAHLLNLPWQGLWDEVQRANMSKVRAATDGSDSKRGSSWDVVKPEGWQPPNIQRVLEDAGFPIASGVDPRCTWCEQPLNGDAAIVIADGHEYLFDSDKCARLWGLAGGVGVRR